MWKMLVLLTWSSLLYVSRAAVLDPALYLSPSPPMKDEPGAVNRWNGVEAEPSTETAVVSEQENLEGIRVTKEEPEVPQARTFWSAQPSYGTRGIHIPLTFSLTGTYGTSGVNTGVVGSIYGNTRGTGLSPIGVIGGSYTSVSDDEPFKYGKSALAGSSYGLYRSGQGTRVYGGSGGASWSGWGNGKWGHYGKG